MRVSGFEPLPDLVRSVLAAARRQPDDSGLYDALKTLELAPGEAPALSCPALCTTLCCAAQDAHSTLMPWNTRHTTPHPPTNTGESLEARMMPFQREGVRFGLKAGGRLLIGDEMGLGKTVQVCLWVWSGHCGLLRRCAVVASADSLLASAGGGQ